MRWNVAVAALAASWGFIALIVAHVGLSAEALVFYRVGIGAVTAALLLAAVGQARRLVVARRDLLRLVALGSALAAHWFLYFETIKLSSVAIAVVTVYTAPIFLALLAPLVLPEERSPVVVAALVPAVAGILLIALYGQGGTHARPLGIACGLAAGITYALLVIVTKRLRTRVEVVAIAFWTYAVAAVVLAPLLALAGRAVPRGGEIGYVVLLGALFTAASGFAYVWLLGRVTAQAVGVLSYLEPLSAALLAWAVLGQPLGWQVAVGGALVLAGGLLVVFRVPEDKAPVEAAGLG